MFFKENSIVRKLCSSLIGQRKYIGYMLADTLKIVEELGKKEKYKMD